jgi:hypothetical protein
MVETAPSSRIQKCITTVPTRKTAREARSAMDITVKAIVRWLSSSVEKRNTAREGSSVELMEFACLWPSEELSIYTKNPIKY